MWLLDYAVGMLTRPPVVRQFAGHSMTPVTITPPVVSASAPACPMAREGVGGPAGCAPEQRRCEPSTFGALTDAAACLLHRCEQITDPPNTGRPYPIRCHNLPRGHSGRCEPFPSAYRMGVEWHAAMAGRIRGLDQLEEAERR